MQLSWHTALAHGAETSPIMPAVTPREPVSSTETSLDFDLEA